MGFHRLLQVSDHCSGVEIVLWICSCCVPCAGLKGVQILAKRPISLGGYKYWGGINIGGGIHFGGGGLVRSVVLLGTSNPPPPRTETCCVLVRDGKHTSAQQEPRQWYHGHPSARKKNRHSEPPPPPGPNPLSHASVTQLPGKALRRMCVEQPFRKPFQVKTTSRMDKDSGHFTKQHHISITM